MQPSIAHASTQIKELLSRCWEKSVAWGVPPAQAHMVRDLGEMSGTRLKNNHSFILCFLSGTVYLDHAGATLFPQSQLTSFTNDLMENVYGKEQHTQTDFHAEREPTAYS